MAAESIGSPSVSLHETCWQHSGYLQVPTLCEATCTEFRLDTYSLELFGEPHMPSTQGATFPRNRQKPKPSRHPKHAKPTAGLSHQGPLEGTVLAISGQGLSPYLHDDDDHHHHHHHHRDMRELEQAHQMFDRCFSGSNMFTLIILKGSRCQLRVARYKFVCGVTSRLRALESSTLRDDP